MRSLFDSPPVPLDAEVCKAWDPYGQLWADLGAGCRFTLEHSADRSGSPVHGLSRWDASLVLASRVGVPLDRGAPPRAPVRYSRRDYIDPGGGALRRLGQSEVDRLGVILVPIERGHTVAEAARYTLWRALQNRGVLGRRAGIPLDALSLEEMVAAFALAESASWSE